MDVFLILCLVLPAVLAEDIASNVIGGANAAIATYPWMLSLRINGDHSCGASLINGLKGITGAYCVGGITSSYTVLAGSVDHTITTCTTCALRTLSEQARHPDYESDAAEGYPNDIATIRWELNILTNANVNYGRMASAIDGDYVFQSCQIIGWGRSCQACGLPTALQVATMTVLTNSDCELRWSPGLINKGHICTWSNTATACVGDGGGSVICSGTIVGVMSWHDAGCYPGYPTVSSRVSVFRPWIDLN